MKGGTVYLNIQDMELLFEIDSHFIDIESVNDRLFKDEEEFRKRFNRLLSKIKYATQPSERIRY